MAYGHFNTTQATWLDAGNPDTAHASPDVLYLRHKGLRFVQYEADSNVPVALPSQTALARGDKRHILLEFNLGSLPASIIVNDALLKVSCTSIGAAAVWKRFGVRWLNQDFNGATATWNTPGIWGAAAGGTSTSSEDGVKSPTWLGGTAEGSTIDIGSVSYPLPASTTTYSYSVKELVQYGMDNRSGAFAPVRLWMGTPSTTSNFGGLWGFSDTVISSSTSDEVHTAMTLVVNYTNISTSSSDQGSSNTSGS